MKLPKFSEDLIEKINEKTGGFGDLILALVFCLCFLLLYSGVKFFF